VKDSNLEGAGGLDCLGVIPYFASVEYIDLDFLGGGGRPNVSEGTNTASSNVCNASSSFLFIVCVLDSD